jgi:hypothetical protein
MRNFSQDSGIGSVEGGPVRANGMDAPSQVMEPPVRIRLRKTLRLDKMLTDRHGQYQAACRGIALCDDRTWPDTCAIRFAKEFGPWIHAAVDNSQLQRPCFSARRA